MQDRLRQVLNVILGLTQLTTNTIWGAGFFGVATVGAVSDSYSTFFTPAGYTFAVWTPIYIGITAYAIYQALPNQRERDVHRRIGLVDCLSRCC